MSTKQNDPRRGLNDDADLYIDPAGGKRSRAYDLTADGILAAEAAGLFHRAALASAEGRNDDRDELEGQARATLKRILVPRSAEGADLSDAREQAQRDAADAARAGVEQMERRGEAKE